jgi:hypothetical protein
MVPVRWSPRSGVLKVSNRPQAIPDTNNHGFVTFWAGKNGVVFCALGLTVDTIAAVVLAEEGFHAMCSYDTSTMIFKGVLPLCKVDAW